MLTPPDLVALQATAAALALLVALIALLRVHAFLALLLAALLLGLLTGMEPAAMVNALQKGIGDTLGSIAGVIALGAILGRLLILSGGAARIAQSLVRRCHPQHVHWAMFFAACLLGIPLFFEVGFVILVPLALVVARSAGLPPLQVGLATLAGLSVMHGLLPPHPGVMLAVQAYGADPGRTLLYGLVVGIPCGLVAGPVFGRLVGPRLGAGAERSAALANDVSTGPAAGPDATARGSAGTGVSLFVVLLPALMMLLRSISDATPGLPAALHATLTLLGSPLIALLCAVVVAMVVLGPACGLQRGGLRREIDASLAPIAAILLIIGAGGGLKQTLISSGVSTAIGHFASGTSLSPLLLAWLMAGAVRVITGSATVAIATASGLVAPLTAAHPEMSRELMALATGAGSLMLSHFNDAGFWLVKEYFGLSVGQTLKSWTVMETLLSVMALLGLLALSTVVHST